MRAVVSVARTIYLEVVAPAGWALALALGLRQGEALGLQWTDVDLDAQLLVVRRNRLRPKYAHGCRKPCGRKYAGHCPERQQIRADADETKSAAGREVMGLPDALTRLLEEHRAAKAHERLHAGQLWVDGGWLFATEVGAPINPRTDWDDWKKLLNTAGIRDSRLHDARHTAATVLLMLGVIERTIMGLMGWSNLAMTRRYAHMVDAVRHETASRIDGLLWTPARDASSGGEPGQNEAG